MLYKNIWKKIKKSLGRYLSIVTIVLVGVGFFTGLQSTVPDITTTADEYYREHNLMDFKIISSLGLTDEDVTALNGLKNVRQVSPSYSLDLFDEDKTLRLSSLSDIINRAALVEGRMPESPDEALADERHYQVGDTIHITSDVEDKLDRTSFTVVGTVDSVLYIARDYGNTTIGDGKLLSFAFIPESNFILDAYTEIYLTIDGADSFSTVSDTYKTMSAQFKDQLTKIKPLRENARYQEILTTAHEEIDKNEAKLLDEKAENGKKLTDAKTKLDKNAKKLSDGKATAEAEFDKAKKELDTNARKLQDGKAELLTGEEELNESVKAQNSQFKAAKASIADGWAQIDVALKQYGLEREGVEQAVNEMSASILAMKTQLAELSPESVEYAQLQAQLTQTTTAYEGLTALKASIADLSAKETELNAGIKTFETKISKARSKIETSKKEIAAGEKKLQDGYAAYRSKLREYRSEMAENEQKLTDGYTTYEKNLSKFQKEIDKAEKKIANARKDLDELEMPVWYVNDRDSAIGYSFLNSANELVARVASIFPFFFIAIVMLMTSNSMARMIAEERGEVGTLSSLGYHDREIIGTYLLYVLSASGLGTVLGFLIGSRLIPPIIYSTFKVILPPLNIRYDLISFSVILLIAFLLMSFVTITACRRELTEKPAMLMRPASPKNGQKIFLERLGFIWNHLSFTWKVTMRNMFRYKKRAVMTIIGVAGCASFLVTGFGLRDSMNGVVPKQYGDILRYSNMSLLKEETSELTTELSTALSKAQVVDPLLLRQSSLQVISGSHSIEALVLVPENIEDFKTYFNLHNYPHGDEIRLDDSGVIITQKIAETYGLKKGDNITVEDSDKNTFELKVANIAENYVSNYIYITREVYQQEFGEEALYNTVVAAQNGEDKEVAQKLINSGYILNVMATTDVMQKALDGNQSLNSIVVLIVIVASLLALLVLYNLTSINISERIREIATLKVLGFRDSETNAYIYREALILALISTLIGMIAGVFLHHIVVDMIEGVGMVLFKRIQPLTFLISFALTMVFSLIMQFITYFKLKTIDMIESLKSVE